MKTFKTYLMEAAGNYISIKSEDLSDLLYGEGMQDPISGKAPPKGDYHCTIMYSKDSEVAPSRILTGLHSIRLPQLFRAGVVGYECFDSAEKGNSCLVVRLECRELDIIHDFLKSYNLVHSYSEFKPHVTLFYDMDTQEAAYYRDILNRSDGRKYVFLETLTSETVNTNYVK